jgi:hypothetical protein
VLAVSMSHKAYAFDWRTFQKDELHALLFTALQSSDAAGIKRYIDAHRDELRDPYEGEALEPDWEAMLENRDVHAYGDFALTRFYDPSDDQGLADDWLVIDGQLSDPDRATLLGVAMGPIGQEFDPGRQGSYFQTPELVIESLRRIESLSARMPQLRSFAELLRVCADSGRGIYVTF